MEKRAVEKLMQCPSCEPVQDCHINTIWNTVAVGLADSKDGREAAHQPTHAVAAGCDASQPAERNGLCDLN